jgi:anionic cell wall polymer biosynthesis LytR-Cps2A-Psr (LCP) family protein
MKRTKRTDKSYLLLILIITVGIIAAVFGFLNLRTDAFTSKLKEKDPVIILFIVSEEGRLYFLDMFLYNPGTKKAGLFYIPSNLGSRIESLDRFDKIDVLYFPDNIEPLRRKLEQVTNLSISYYIDISMQNIGRLVDLLGGLELFISNPVDIDTGKERYLLPSGSVLLDGSKVRDYLKYEEEIEEDSERVRRKQNFFGALLKKLGNPATNAFVLDKKVFPYLKSFLNSNLNVRALKSLLEELTRLKAERLLTQGQRVLGNLKIVEGVEGEVLFPYHDGNLMKQTISQNLATIASEENNFDDTTLISMEILNGTNQDGLAKRTKVLFESFGFEILSIRNAEHDQYLNTLILDRKGKIESAERAAKVIRCERIYTKIETGVNVDITLILGKDFDGRYCK